MLKKKQDVVPGLIQHKTKSILLKIGAILLAFVLTIFHTSLHWAMKNYGNISIEEILFHLSMPIAGTAEHVIDSYFNAIIQSSLIVLAVIVATFVITWLVIKCANKINKIKINKIMRIFSLCVITLLYLGYAIWFGHTLSSADKEFQIFDWIKAQTQNSSFIEDNYVDPESIAITFPEQKRNLICIYVESAETTNQNKENGGMFDTNLIPEMTELAKNNISFSQSDKIEGAAVSPACGWTIAGLTASTSGLPLKLYAYDDKSIDNSMGTYEYFLPGATSLGDVLDDNGYKNYFMAGSDFSFGGRTNYFVNHGNYKIFDYYTAIESEQIPSDYKVWWGFEDEILYNYAKKELTTIASKDEPFNFSMITVDTHHENGYKCNLCEQYYTSQEFANNNDRYANAWRCASKQLDDFVNWCKEQPFYENTTIVIIGDHCSMDSDFYDNASYNKHLGSIERKVYNCFINSAQKATNYQNRQFTTLDFYPTILASMGATIEGNRLGLGTNLFSSETTLAEQYGYDVLFEELNKKSTFYNSELLYP